MPEPVIRCERLNKTYPGGARALVDVDLDVYGDEFIAVIGSSGAGKSTLLRCVNRLIDPADGRMYLHDEDITDVTGRRLRRVRERVGMIFQQFNLVSRLTVLQNVLCGRLRFCRGPIRGPLSLCRWFSREDVERAMACLDEVGIAGFASRRADELSGGQQQRVAIARVLAQEPEVILADEPVASLDPASCEVVMTTLARLGREHAIPVVVNLHHVELARRFATRIVGMRAGRVAFDLANSELDDRALDRLYAPGVEVKHDRGQTDPPELAPGTPVTAPALPGV